MRRVSCTGRNPIGGCGALLGLLAEHSTVMCAGWLEAWATTRPGVVVDSGPCR